MIPSPTLLLEPASGQCRLCGATADQTRICREPMLNQGQWLAECGACRCLYLTPDPSQTELNRFYRDDYRRLYPFETHPAPDDRFLTAIRSREFGWRRAKSIAPTLPHAARVLEIGSGFGNVLGQLGRLRPDCRLSAIEPDTQHRTLALDGAEVTFLTGDRLSGQPPFHAILLFHTLEHILDPVHLLQGLAASLHPEGRLFIEVPDTPPSLTAALVHPAHVTYFTAATLFDCLTRAGLFPVHSIAGAAALPGCLWIEARPIATADSLPAPEAAPPVTTPVTTGRRWSVLRRMLPPSLLGRISRWRHGPDIDDSLTTTENRRYRWGIGFDDIDLPTLLNRVNTAVKTRTPLRVADINVAKLIGLQDNPLFRSTVQSADLVVADGVGVIWGAKLAGLPIRERIAGADLLEHILTLSAERGWRPFLLGTKDSILDTVAALLRHRLPELQLAGRHSGYFKEEQEPAILDLLTASGADILIVALPSPRQDLFLERMHRRSGIPVAFGVGGSLDVLSGTLRRAPLWIQRIGCEWLFRLCQEPLRLGPRYLISNSRFLLLLLSDLTARALRRR